MFNLDKHRREYAYDLYTVVENQLPEAMCERMVQKAHAAIAGKNVSLVDHRGLGTAAELDRGGRYLHHIFKGDDIRRHVPELESIYLSLTNLVSAITMQDVVVSPHSDSDINIKAYPPHGGTLGSHLDTNGITVLIYLTTNQEGPLVLELERDHPSLEEPERYTRKLFAKAGSMLVMQGRKVWHHSEPMVNESKMVAVFNYYVRGDTWRPPHFDRFVYDGRQVELLPVPLTPPSA